MSHLFDPLPTLQEGEELVSLTDVLDLRRGCLREAEMWAVCKECVLSLEAFRRASADLFSKLCLSPDTLAFDGAGGVCFIDTDTVDHNFRPPEYTEKKGTSLKGHLYSLARTLLEAAEYCLPDDNEAEISQPLYDLVNLLAAEDPTCRPDATEVVKTCERNLDDPSTFLCRRLSSISRRKISIDSCYDFPVNDEPLLNRRPSTSSQVLFSRRHSLSNGTSWDSLSPSHVFDIASSPSPTSLRSPSPGCQAGKMAAESGRSRLAEPEDEMPLREAPTTAALNNLSQRAQDILKKIYSTNEAQSKPAKITNGAGNDTADCKRSPVMRRHNSIASMGSSLSGGRLGSNSGSASLQLHSPLSTSKSLDPDVPAITISAAHENGQGIGNDSSPTPNSVKVSAALARFLKSRKQQCGEDGDETGSSVPIDDASLTKEEAAVDLRNDSPDEYSGSTEPLSPLGTEDFSLLEGGMILDDPWLDDEESDPESPVEFKRTLRSHSIAAFHSVEPRSSAFRMNQHHTSKSNVSSKSSRSSLNDITEEHAGAKTKIDTAGKRARRKTESVSGTDLSYNSIRDLNKLQDFFANRRSSIADFRPPAGLLSKATHFTPIVVSDEKSESNKSLTRSTSSPSVEGAKAKARAAMEAIKMDLKAPKKQPPPANMLESLENDAIASTAPSPSEHPEHFSEQPLQVTGENNNKVYCSVPIAESTPVSKKPVYEIVGREETERTQAGNVEPLHKLDTQVDKRKASLELEGINLKSGSQPDQRNLLRDSTSNGEIRVQKAKVKVVQGSPISRDSAFSPIQKPHRLKPELMQTISRGSAMSSQPESAHPTAFLPVTNKVTANLKKASEILNNQCPAVPTTQSPAVAPVHHIQNNLFGQVSPMRLASPQAIHPLGNPAVSHAPGVSGMPSGAVIPNFPLKVHLQQDPATGLFHVLPVDLQDSPVICQGSPVVSQGSPALSQGSSTSSQGLHVIPQIAVAAAQGEASTGPSVGPQVINVAPTVSTTSPSSAHGKDPLTANVKADSQKYWNRHKSPGASSDGESTCIPVTPEMPRKETSERKRELMKKRNEKAKHFVSPSKRAQAKGTLNRASESESSESSYLESLRIKSSPKVVRKKPTKASTSHSDPDRMRERNHDRSKSHSHDRSSKPEDSKSRSKSCERPKAVLSVRKADAKEAPHKTPDKSGHPSRPHHVSHKPRDNHPPSKKMNYSTDDIDDTRPVDPSRRQATSPISMSSLSRDSGVNLRYSMSSGEELPTLSEVHLADVLQGNAKLKTVIKLIRQAFAYDGYLENGVEDLAMAEYITSLGKLSWLTFNNAISEKFCDLYWEEDLLGSLFEAVNGQKPARQAASGMHPKPRLAVPKKPARSKPGRDGHSSSHQKTSPLATTGEKKASPASASTRSKDEAEGRSKASGSKSKEPEEKKRTPDAGEEVGPRSTGTSKDDEKKAKDARVVRKQPKDSPVAKPNRTAPRSDSSASESRGRSTEPLPVRGKNAKEAPSLDAQRSFQESHENGGKQPLADRVHGKDLEKDIPACGTSEKKARRPGVASLGAADQKEMSNGTEADETRKTRAEFEDSDLSKDFKKKGQFDGRNGILMRRIGSETMNATGESLFMGASLESSSLDLNLSRTSPTSSLASSSIVSRDKTTPDDLNISTASSLTSSLFTPSLLNSPTSPSGNASDSSDSTSRKISEMLRRSLNRQGSQASLSSASSGNSRSQFNNSDTISLPSMSSFSESVDESRCGLPGGVLYRGENIDPTVEAYTLQLTGMGGTQQNIDAKIADVEQQLMMEKRMRTKTEKFYRKLLYNQQTKGSGTDHKHMVSKVGKQILEMTKRIEFLESSKKHLEMLYAEQWGLELGYLYSLATSTGKTSPDLRLTDDNPLLAFQTSRNKVTLQAGQPPGLISFLFARHALVRGYLPHFFYTYHYFVTAEEIFQFIAHNFALALRMSGQYADIRTKIMCRTLDILQVWVEGFFEADFKPNPQLLQDVLVFVTDKVVPVDPNGQCLVQLIDKHQQDQPGISLIVATQREDIKDQLPSDKSFPSKDVRGLLGASGRGKLKAGLMACLTKRDPSKQVDSAYLPTMSMEKGGFSLGDHTSLALAYQLTLLQQELFHCVHPVHYLNSRSKGIGVNTNHYDGAGGKGQGGGADAHDTPSLFLAPLGDDGAVRALLRHAKDISHWVSAEIVSCSSTKTQLVLLCKFINVAKACYDLRNYASCVQILDSLDSLIVRQVPAWRNLPSKVVALYEELCAAKVLLQGDSESLVKGDAHKGSPTLPSTLLFLMHVQQLEIGGFTLANGMYKWIKMRSIAKFVDHIRVFQEHAYTFDANKDLQDLLRQRILECCDQDIHVLAARHSSNVHQLSSDKSSRRLQNAFQKVKATLH